MRPTAGEPSPPTITAAPLPYPGAPGDVPRSNTGWPTIEPSAFTAEQLLREAAGWGGGAPGTVGGSEFDKYALELVRRGFLDEIDLREWRSSRTAPVLVFRASSPGRADQRRWTPQWPRERTRADPAVDP